MKRKIFLSAIIALLLSGCDLFKDVSAVNSDNSAVSETSLDQNITFESESARKIDVITDSCKYNDDVAFRYFATPEQAHEEYWKETKNLVSEPGSGKALKPFWDFRYVNSGELLVKDERRLDAANHAIYTGLDARFGKKNLEAGVESADSYADASVVQAKCIDGSLAAGTSVNLLDSDLSNIEYGGPQSTFIYRMAKDKVVVPWLEDQNGSLVIEGNFTKPFYTKYSDNMGGGVNVGLFLQNKKSGVELNYIITLYAVGKAWANEQADLKYDTTTGIVHIQSVVANNTKWTTKSPKSKATELIKSQSKSQREDINNWRDFYRVNITYQNLLNVLKALKEHPPAEVEGVDFGLNPADWKVNSIYVQYELEEQGGDALLSGSFKGFKAYMTKLPR